MPRATAINRVPTANRVNIPESYFSVHHNGSDGKCSFGSSAAYLASGYALWFRDDGVGGVRIPAVLYIDGNNYFTTYSVFDGGSTCTLNVSVRKNGSDTIGAVSTYHRFDAHHLVVTWDASDLRIFLDGNRVFLNSGNYAISPGATPSFLTGGFPTLTTPWVGYTTQCILFDEKVTDDEAAALHRSGIHPIGKVSCYWPHTEGSGNVRPGPGSGGLDGTLGTGITWTTDTPRRPRAANAARVAT